MKNLVIVNALAATAHVENTLPDGSTSLGRVAAFARKLPGVDRVVLLLDDSAVRPAGASDADRRLWRPSPKVVQGFATEGFVVEHLAPAPGSRVPSLRKALARILALSEGYEAVFYVFADCPLLDPGLSGTMHENHRKYYADYTFADGYPYGVTPEILRVGVLPALIALAERDSGKPEADEPLSAGGRQALFELIKRDINAFDLETELSPVDLRLLRVELCTDTRRNSLLVEGLLAAGASDGSSACRILQEQPEILRTLPAFVNIQVVEGCPQLCSYCPYGQRSLTAPGKKGEMELERFQRILEQVHGLCEDAVVGLSLWGEPAYHSQFPRLAAAVLERGLRLVVETSGIGWHSGALAETARVGGDIDWVVSLDSADPDVYRKLRGEGQEAALATVETLQQLFPGRVYPQAVRMADNEEGLEGFYRHWKKTVGNVIIQKYDHFCGALPERKVTDLSPLKRFPCWHLKRDVSVLLDGRVPLCREDLAGEHLLGNAFEEPLEKIWKRGDAFYRLHLSGDYPRLCAQCDEHYTFNF